MNSKKKYRNKIFEIYVPIYGRYIIIDLGSSDLQLKNYIKKYRNLEWCDELEVNGGGICAFHHDLGLSIIRIKEFVNNPRFKGLLAHEIYHCSQYILRDLGITPSKDSEEAYAYLIGWITEKIYEKINF